MMDDPSPPPTDQKIHNYQEKERNRDENERVGGVVNPSSQPSTPNTNTKPKFLQSPAHWEWMAFAFLWIELLVVLLVEFVKLFWKPNWISGFFSDGEVKMLKILKAFLMIVVLLAAAYCKYCALSLGKKSTDEIRHGVLSIKDETGKTREKVTDVHKIADHTETMLHEVNKIVKNIQNISKSLTTGLGTVNKVITSVENSSENIRKKSVFLGKELLKMSEVINGVDGISKQLEKKVSSVDALIGKVNRVLDAVENVKKKMQWKKLERSPLWKPYDFDEHSNNCLKFKGGYHTADTLRKILYPLEVKFKIWYDEILAFVEFDNETAKENVTLNCHFEREGEFHMITHKSFEAGIKFEEDSLVGYFHGRSAESI
eukprot:TRINITY_DN775813_c0_g1_i1.p1 TRINITY_DN775813_c0_g1~~TRINITY_DN775813_c0_g1_i1.p1  ORF type:complete len:372 (+),score=48.97 TRINITY_DN775813_c0_g1_i1:66-1181(+)